jgi:hypothetical protein
MCASSWTTGKECDKNYGGNIKASERAASFLVIATVRKKLHNRNFIWMVFWRMSLVSQKIGKEWCLNK